MAKNSRDFIVAKPDEYDIPHFPATNIPSSNRITETVPSETDNALQKVLQMISQSVLQLKTSLLDELSLLNSLLSTWPNLQVSHQLSEETSKPSHPSDFKELALVILVAVVPALLVHNMVGMGKSTGNSKRDHAKIPSKKSGRSPVKLPVPFNALAERSLVRSKVS